MVTGKGGIQPTVTTVAATVLGEESILVQMAILEVLNIAGVCIASSDTEEDGMITAPYV